MSIPASQKGRTQYIIRMCVRVCVNDRFTIRRSEKYQRPSVCNLKDILLLFTDIKFGFQPSFQRSYIILYMMFQTFLLAGYVFKYVYPCTIYHIPTMTALLYLSRCRYQAKPLGSYPSECMEKNTQNPASAKCIRPCIILFYHRRRGVVDRRRRAVIIKRI